MGLSLQHTFLFYNGITIKLGRCAVPPLSASRRRQQRDSDASPSRQWNLAKKLSSSIPLHSSDHEQPKLVYDVIELKHFFSWAVQITRFGNSTDINYLWDSL